MDAIITHLFNAIRIDFKAREDNAEDQTTIDGFDWIVLKSNTIKGVRVQIFKKPMAISASSLILESNQTIKVLSCTNNAKAPTAVAMGALLLH